MIAIAASLLALALQADKAQELKVGDLTFKAPSDWETTPDEKSLLTLLTPIEGEKDTFRENLRISATDVDAKATIDALYKDAYASFEKPDHPLKLTGKGTLTANGHKVLWMALKPKQPAAGQEPLTLVEYGFVHAGKAWSFKAMAADAKVARFRGEVEKALKTLEPKAGK